MKTNYLILLLFAILIAGCVSEQKDFIDEASFSCENDNTVESRGYVLLMGFSDHYKEGWDNEKKLMQQDPKAKFVIIYDQDENSNIKEISDKFLFDMHSLLQQTRVDELVIFGSSAGGVTSSYSLSRLNFSGAVALHTLASPLKGYDLTGFRAQFLGNRTGFMKDIAVGFEPFEKPKDNVKVYHHKTVTDSVLIGYCGDLAAFCDAKEIQNNNIEESKEFYYPQYDHDTIMGAVIRDVLKCYNSDIQIPNLENEPRLGNMCIGYEKCNAYCKDNFGRCQEYCESNIDNELCQKPFEFEQQ